MINLDNLTEESVGAWVVYDNGYARDKGRIKSWNDHFIFVVYHCDNNWSRFQDYTGCATNPDDLEFI